jgi:hypothetical protein
MRTEVLTTNLELFTPLYLAGCLKHQGKPKTLEDMDNAIRQGVEES